MEVKLPNQDEWALDDLDSVVMKLHIHLICTHCFMLNMIKVAGNLKHIILNTGILNHSVKTVI
jgi:hypothetical protein